MVSETEIHPNSRFYFLVGSNESEAMVPDMTKMVDLLLVKGLAKDHVKDVIIEGGQHNEALWRNNFPDAYQWLIKN